MLHPRRSVVVLAGALLLAGGAPVLGQPLVDFADEGRTFLYRARPGDHPSAVARMFGVPPEELPAFLAANGITDATRVGAGFVYRIPNAPARALAERLAALEAEHARLAGEAGEAESRLRALTRELRAWLEGVWPAARAAAVVLALLAAAAVGVAGAALRRQRQAARYARALAQELDLKRQAAMAERQESARRILDLETRVRTLESQLGPRVVVGGRSS
jgi:hypothetical protein